MASMRSASGSARAVSRKSAANNAGVSSELPSACAVRLSVSSSLDAQPQVAASSASRLKP